MVWGDTTFHEFFYAENLCDICDNLCDNATIVVAYATIVCDNRNSIK